MQKVPMTKEGFDALQVELKQLKTIERPQVTQDIAEARAHGDLKENAEYHAAREKQSFVEGRIVDVESKLSCCQVIDVTTMPNTGKVIFGSTVSICHHETDEEVRYKIVGEDEASIKENKISVTSPIARALVGKQVDDEVVVQTPEGEVHYDIIAVDYIA
jgi:transcription elongation factor GreA